MGPDSMQSSRIKKSGVAAASMLVAMIKVKERYSPSAFVSHGAPNLLLKPESLAIPSSSSGYLEINRRSLRQDARRVERGH